MGQSITIYHLMAAMALAFVVLYQFEKRPFLGAMIVVLLIWAIGIGEAFAALPPRAKQYGPVLVKEQRVTWPAAPVPWTLGGLIEQETCPSPTHWQCWNPRAELKTSREYGFGLGQITITKRYNEFNELKSKYKSLAGWKWDDRYDPGYQLIALVEMVQALWGKMPPAHDQGDHWAFTLASYNGGLSGLLQDRRYCANSKKCDNTVWFGNVETHSLKSKVPHREYGGKSFYQINRGYVRNVLTLRRAKYKPLWPTVPPPPPAPVPPSQWWNWISTYLIGDLS